MDMASAADFAARHEWAGDAALPDASVRVLTRVDLVQPEFHTQWNALVASASEPNPFLEPWFLLPSLEQWGDRVTIKAVFMDGSLCGLYPLLRAARYYGYPLLHATGWLHANAFCGTPLVARGHEYAFWSALLAHFDRAARLAMFLHVPRLPSDGPVGKALEEVLARQGRARHVVRREVRAMLASDLDAQDYLEAAMSAKKRKELRRQQKRLADLGKVSFERRADAEDLDEWSAEFLALEASGWKGAAGSALASSTDTGAFVTNALRGAAEAGRLERLALRLEGRAIAMLVTFRCPPGAFSFKTAFDESYARFSPGLLLQLENLETLNDPSIAWSDSCAAPGHSMIERVWQEKRVLASHNIAIGGLARRCAFGALMAWETRNARHS